MKKFFGILFVFFGILNLPNVLAPGLPETIGRLIGFCLFFVLPAYFLLRNSNEKKENNENQDKSSN